jgi:hypothetical protein
MCIIINIWRRILMETNDKCPICGCCEIGKGILRGYADMAPVNNRFFNNGSPIIADICTKCGHILSMRVTKPEKFK